MGIYVFNRRTLQRFLTEDSKRSNSPHDIGYAVILK